MEGVFPLILVFWLLISVLFSLSTTKGNVKFHAVIFSVVEDKFFIFITLKSQQMCNYPM